MNPLALPLNAHHLVRAETHALLLDEQAPQQTVRLALVVRGTERHVFPALALDDWGREKKGPGLHRWLYEQGNRFPRAELFGVDAGGDEIQIFLRDLEVSFLFPCYLFPRPDDPISAGLRLHTIFVPGDSTQSQPQKISAPDALPFPLRRAALHWRQVHAAALPTLGWQPYSPAQ